MAALTLFEAEFPPETPPVSTARCRREADAAEAGVRFQAPTSQSAGPAVQQRIFRNSSLPAQSDLLDPGLAGVYDQNPALSDTQPVDNGAVDFDGGRVQGYGSPPCGSQPGNGWYNPNQNGYYQPMKAYPSHDPAVQHAFNQECNAAQLANHYQSVAEQNAKAAEEKGAHVEQEIVCLRQSFQQ